MHLAVGDLIVRNALDRPDGVALIDGTKSSPGGFKGPLMPARQWSASIGDRSNRPRRYGHQKRRRSSRSPVRLSLGGLVWVPINYGLSTREIEGPSDDSRPDAIMLDAEFIPQFKPLLGDRRVTVIVVTQSCIPGGWTTISSSPPAVRIRQSLRVLMTVRTIRYTSGTTAAPKGCVGTHRQILASIDNFFHDVPVPDGPFLQLLPLFSGAGIWMAIAAAYRGLANVLMPSFDFREALRLIQAHRVAHTCGVPTMVRRLCDEFERGSYELSSLKLFGYTGSPMPESVIRRALNVLPCDFYQGFGGGELAAASFLLPDVTAPWPPGHSQRNACRLPDGSPPTRRSLFAIFSRRSHRAQRDRRNHGPLVQQLLCIHNRPEETANTLRGPWVHTGDVGYIDDDGFLFVADRVKDMVLSGGMNISSAEVEGVLVEHPAVQAAAVIGVPDDEWGEIVTGVVTTRPSTSVTEADLIKFCASGLPDTRPRRRSSLSISFR